METHIENKGFNLTKLIRYIVFGMSAISGSLMNSRDIVRLLRAKIMNM